MYCVMKKYFYLATALVALAACSGNDFANETTAQVAANNGNAISFGFDLQNVTRAGDQVGADAANTLQSQFIVYGTKHAADEVAAETNDVAVFKNYKVEYTANSAGTKTSNTHNWDYVGLSPFTANVSPVATSQTVKFWDYSAANGYTFYGIASKADIATGYVKVTKTTAVTGDGASVYDKGYTVILDKNADLTKLYVADRLPVAKTDYNKPVTLKFRNFGARARVGFYETIPGYTVKIDKFYVDGDATAAVTTFGAMDVANTTNFAASLQNIKTNPTGTNTIAVSYYNGTNGPVNQVKLGASTVEYNYSLVLGTGINSATELATSSATPTWDNTDGAYTPVYPFEANSNPMLIKVDYTLTSEDGGGETIKVIGANVVVPTQYVQWKSNYAYTYIFKIAPNTNGKTGDVQGLYPITFDAVTVEVADGNTQETITTFEDYSLTSYSNGSKVTVNDEYKKGKDIYVVKMNNSTGAIVAQTIGTDAVNKAQVYVVTQEAGADAVSEATITAKLNGAPNGIVLTAVDPVAELASSAPAADASTYEFGADGAVKFTPGAAGTYAYVSVRTVNVSAEYTAVGEAAWDNTKTYYFKTNKNVYYAAAGINEANFATYKASLYTQDATPTPVDGVYDIKIIKVVD